jgi:hypothetical protein
MRDLARISWSPLDLRRPVQNPAAPRRAKIAGTFHARSLAPLVKARGFGMTKSGELRVEEQILTFTTGSLHSKLNHHLNSLLILGCGRKLSDGSDEGSRRAGVGAVATVGKAELAPEFYVLYRNQGNLAGQDVVLSEG